VEQSTNQDGPTEKQLAAAEVTPKDKKSKEKKKDDKQSRFERIQAALRRALEALLSRDDAKSDKSPKPEKSVANEGDLEQAPPSDYLPQTVQPELVPSAADDSHEVPGAVDSQSADTTWQRARVKVREFIQSRLPSDKTEASLTDEPPQLTETERRTMTVSELENRYRVDYRDQQPPSATASPQPVLSERLAMSRRRREQRKQAKKLEQHKQQLADHERRLEDSKPRPLVSSGRPIAPSPVAVAHAPHEVARQVAAQSPTEQPIREQGDTTLDSVDTAIRPQNNQGETRVDYPPAPSVEELEQPKPTPLRAPVRQLIDNGAESVIYQRVEPSPKPVTLLQPETRRSPQADITAEPVMAVNTEPQTAAPKPSSESPPPLAQPETATTLSEPAQSVGEIIRQRHVDKLESSRTAVTAEQRERSSSASSGVTERLGGSMASASIGGYSLEVQASQPQVIQPDASSAKEKSSGKQASVGWWQQALLVLLNLVLIGLLVRELVL